MSSVHLESGHRTISKLLKFEVAKVHTNGYKSLIELRSLILLYYVCNPSDMSHSEISSQRSSEIWECSIYWQLTTSSSPVIFFLPTQISGWRANRLALYWAACRKTEGTYREATASLAASEALTYGSYRPALGIPPKSFFTSSTKYSGSRFAETKEWIQWTLSHNKWWLLLWGNSRVKRRSCRQGMCTHYSVITLLLLTTISTVS